MKRPLIFLAVLTLAMLACSYPFASDSASGNQVSEPKDDIRIALDEGADWYVNHFDFVIPARDLQEGFDFTINPGFQESAFGRLDYYSLLQTTNGGRKITLTVYGEAADSGSTIVYQYRAGKCYPFPSGDGKFKLVPTDNVSQSKWLHAEACK